MSNKTFENVNGYMWLLFGLRMICCLWKPLRSSFHWKLRSDFEDEAVHSGLFCGIHQHYWWVNLCGLWSVEKYVGLHFIILSSLFWVFGRDAVVLSWLQHSLLTWSKNLELLQCLRRIVASSDKFYVADAWLGFWERFMALFTKWARPDVWHQMAFDDAFAFSFVRLGERDLFGFCVCQRKTNCCYSWDYDLRGVTFTSFLRKHSTWRGIFPSPLTPESSFDFYTYSKTSNHTLCARFTYIADLDSALLKTANPAKFEFGRLSRKTDVRKNMNSPGFFLSTLFAQEYLLAFLRLTWIHDSKNISRHCLTSILVKQVPLSRIFSRRLFRI